MRKFQVWCACLMAWMIACTASALANERYTSLCAEKSAVQEETSAWMEIPAANLLLPVMQHGEDDAFYASHDQSGAKAEYGVLYTQSAYNAANLSDPVTLIYGSSKSPGAPLRDLQELYSGKFDECRTILLHLPDGTREYQVFAALPYSSIHILHYYDFQSQRRFEEFFDTVYSTRALGMHLDQENRPEYGDSIVILSTGLRGDAMQRYLVMAKWIH